LSGVFSDSAEIESPCLIFAKNFDGSLKAYLPLFGGGQSQQVITTLTGECSALTLVEPRGIPKTFYIIAAIMGWHIAAYS